MLLRIGQRQRRTPGTAKQQPTFDPQMVPQLFYRIESSRGYDASGDLWNPGFFRFELSKGEQATLVASTERWETMAALPPSEATSLESERRSLWRLPVG